MAPFSISNYTVWATAVAATSPPITSVSTPLEKMLEYNSFLLTEGKPSKNKPLDSKAALLGLLKGMTAEERAALMAEAAK